MWEKFSRFLTSDVTVHCVLILFSLINSNCQAQKYSFTHYDINNGLIESQVKNLMTDKAHRLWLSTNGGATRFDGLGFISFTRKNGLPTNFVNQVYTDVNGSIWFGTQNGLVKLVRDKLLAIKMPDNLQDNSVSDIVQDADGTVWEIAGGRLCRIQNHKLQIVTLDDNVGQMVTCMAADHSGRVFVAVKNRGIYCLHGGRWRFYYRFPPEQHDLMIKKIVPDISNGNIYLLTKRSLYRLSSSFRFNEVRASRKLEKPFLCLAQDPFGSLWIGALKGAYCLKGDKVLHFTGSNGFTDNPVNDIYTDSDNNLWLGSEGDGFFKYNGERVISYNIARMVNGKEVVTAITKSKGGHILLGIDGGGLLDLADHKMMSLPQNEPFINRIQCLRTANSGLIWIGTAAGLWLYEKGKYSIVPGTRTLSINSITDDEHGRMWITSPTGCFYVRNKVLNKLKGANGYCSSATTYGGDSLFVGTSNGLLLVVKNKVKDEFVLNSIKDHAVYCLLKMNELLLIGTDDGGLYTWNAKNGHITNYTTADGLTSNTIYSLVADPKGALWVGTGRGISRCQFDEGTGRFEIAADTDGSDFVFECNQNAIFLSGNTIWVGTTKGVFAYATDAKVAPSGPPESVIQAVTLYSDTARAGRQSILLKNNAQLRPDQNHLTIDFRGVYLRNPRMIRFCYKLEGLDSSFSQPVSTNSVNYPSLPSGSYTFKVQALAGNKKSAQTATFSFTILPPYYQTPLFRAITIAFLILMGFALHYSWQYKQLRRQRRVEAIKKEENLRIRQQTTEDFHDELGNKLTRITILSELLDDTLDASQSDQKRLLGQITSTATSLYNGTKDILWALDVYYGDVDHPVPGQIDHWVS